MTLTAAGEAFLPHAEAALREVERARTAARRISHGDLGTIRIGFTSAASLNPLVPGGDQLVPQRVPRRRAAAGRPADHPAARANVAGHDRRGVRASDLDRARVTARDSVAGRTSLDCLPTGHALATRKRLRLGDLRNEPFILYPRANGSLLYDAIIAACQNAGFSPRVVQEAPQMASMVSLVAAGVGVTLVPESVCQLRPAGVRYIPIHGQTPVAMLWLVAPRGAMAAGVEQFSRHAERFFKTPPAGHPERTHTSLDLISSRPIYWTSAFADAKVGRCMRHTFFLWAALLLLTPVLHSQNAAPGRLRAGAAMTDITPKDSDLAVSTDSIRDHLFARAVVVDNGGTCAVMAGVGPRRRVQRSSETMRWRAPPRPSAVHPQNFLISATHTHSSNAGGLGQGSPTAKTVADGLVEAITRAKSKLAPARIGFGTTRVDLNVNRDLFNRKFEWRQEPNPDGPSDKTLAVIGLVGDDNVPIAVYMNYAMHPINFYLSGVISADFPGEASRYVEDLFEGRTVAIFSQGASGDQNPRDFRSPSCSWVSAPR